MLCSMKSNLMLKARVCLGLCLTPVRHTLALFVLTCLILSCGTGAKLKRLQNGKISATIRLPTTDSPSDSKQQSEPDYRPGSIEIEGPDGRKHILMEAIRDEQTGEMVASERIEAAYITTRFKNVAERGGVVRLEFQIVVPKALQDPNWQLRFYPRLYMLGDSLDLDEVLITGKEYRKLQLRGYQRYENFLNRIISDSTKLIDMRNFELFVKRNIPQLYAFRNDTTYVSEEEFVSALGVSETEARNHYTKWLLVDYNNWLISSKSKRFKRYVTSPLREERVKIDTVTNEGNSDIVYDYVQVVKTNPKLKKIDLVLSGGVYEAEKQLYNIPATEALSYYVSSVRSFADAEPKYKTQIISRNLNIAQSCIINFDPGSSEVKEDDNQTQIQAIKSSLRKLAQDKSVDIDSIVIVATCSPEGSIRSNLRLSYNRAKSVSDYFDSYLKAFRDSLAAAEMLIDYASELSASGPSVDVGQISSVRDIDFISNSGGENWTLLDVLVEQDSCLSKRELTLYNEARMLENLDRREACLRQLPIYTHLYKEHYPRLRVVYFNFFLHRTGMIKDTVITNVLDTTYMLGVKALQEQDYEQAVEKLSNYRDFNAALACTALGRNYNAMAILESCPDNAKSLYLKALLFSRMEDEKQAIECLLRACELEPSYIHRANLDPEISILKNKYNLFSE